jgi:hypothetical protein
MILLSVIHLNPIRKTQNNVIFDKFSKFEMGGPQINQRKITDKKFPIIK